MSLDPDDNRNQKTTETDKTGLHYAARTFSASVEDLRTISRTSFEKVFDTIV